MSAPGRFFITVLCVAVTSVSAVAYAEEYHYGVQVETVNAYDACFSGANLSNSNQSGDAFISALLYPGAPFALFQQWQDATVWDTDFLDPDLSGSNSHDDDTRNFDQPNLAISFFQGHGLGITKPVPDQLCGFSAECIAPPHNTSVGNTGTGACVLSPSSVAKYGPGTGVCEYKATPALVTCGSNDQNNHFVFLTPYMALGENATVGDWRGAATNGGTSLAIVKMSFGMVTFFPTQWWSLFAGLHIYEGVMVSWGDSEDSVGFGGAVASPATLNPYSSVVESYMNAINNITDGGGCSDATTWGGGFNGCGCHVAMTLSASGSGSATVFRETWLDLSVDDPEQSGAQGGWQWAATCNYNPQQYPWSGGDHP